MLLRSGHAPACVFMSTRVGIRIAHVLRPGHANACVFVSTCVSILSGEGMTVRSGNGYRKGNGNSHTGRGVYSTWWLAARSLLASGLNHKVKVEPQTSDKKGTHNGGLPSHSSKERKSFADMHRRYAH
eukprot:scaffold277332_cov19-Tisochrysis_lutea.AAC.1